MSASFASASTSRIPQSIEQKHLSSDSRRRAAPFSSSGAGRLLLVVFILGVALCRCLYAQSAKPAADDKKADKYFYSAKDRLDAMQVAALFVPRVVAEADIMQGPAQNKKQFQLHFNDKVICDFATPGSKMGGKTPKFGCKITSVESANGQVQTLTPDMDEKDPVKVKFGANDNEVYAEVAATRLMWAMGYYADSWFPVRVECHNCPANPDSGAGPASTRTFDPATIVRKFSWREMTEAGKTDQGWSWKELEAANGRPNYERDGLRLLAAFMKHSDNKPPQQRLACNKVDVDNNTQSPTDKCDKSVMMVQDVGATFGRGGWFTSNTKAKMNLALWSRTKLWKKVGTEGAPRHCQAALTKSLSAHDGLSNPTISEEGRRFDAGLMCQLTDHQIEDLFKTARAAEMPEYHNSDGSFKAGVDEASIMRRWVQAFKQEREDLASGRCEWQQKPPDLAAIDNPMGLATVPNYCSAKPF
jgi:hypothetical protein